MKIYRIAKILSPEERERQRGILFDICVEYGETSGVVNGKEEWNKRAEQVMEGKVHNEYFAHWLMRNANDELVSRDCAELCRELANDYFQINPVFGKR